MGTTEWRGRMALQSKLIGTALLVAALTACSSPKTSEKTRSKEYFPESKYGVKASPRVANTKTNIKRGGGRHQVGKPYKVRGNWFHPKVQPNYSKTGIASWYGDAFHGRLTANGEIYDMTHLTAAHPTLPLPSYARVTNAKNNSSVIVRINDRGPFANNRLIDLSKRTAELLDFKQTGTAEVQVEYLGPAPLHGQDDAYLMASYQPSGRAPDPSDGYPTGVMLAMNGPTPTVQANATQGIQTVSAAIAAASTMPVGSSSGASHLSFAADDVTLPSIAPIPLSRPGVELAALSYAEQRIQSSTQMFEPLLNTSLAQTTVTDWWNAQQQAEPATDLVNLGLWSSHQKAQSIAQSLAAYGQVKVEAVEGGQLSLALAIVDEQTLNGALQAAWNAGATDAFIVRN